LLWSLEQQMFVSYFSPFFSSNKVQKTSSKKRTHKLDMPGRHYNSLEFTVP